MFNLLFTFRCLPCRVWHPPKSGKARRHCPSPLSQAINIRPSPLVFHLSFPSPLSLSPGFFVGSSFPSHDPSLRPQPTSGRGIILAMVGFIGPVSTPPIWPRLVPCGSAHGLPRLMARTCRPSRPSSVPPRAILEPSSTISFPSLSVLQCPIHGWPFTPRSISTTTISHAVLGHRHCHDKGASKVEPAQNHRLCAKTHRINASHHLERVSYCAAGEWMV